MKRALLVALALPLLTGCAAKKPAKAHFWRDCEQIAFDVKTQSKTFRCSANSGESYMVVITPAK